MKSIFWRFTMKWCWERYASSAFSSTRWTFKGCEGHSYSFLYDPWRWRSIVWFGKRAFQSSQIQIYVNESIVIVSNSNTSVQLMNGCRIWWNEILLCSQTTIVVHQMPGFCIHEMALIRYTTLKHMYLRTRFTRIRDWKRFTNAIYRWANNDTIHEDRWKTTH
jgi:hypothetical protein